MTDEEIVEQLMSPHCMTLTPSQARAFDRPDLRMEALRRLRALESPSSAQLCRIAEITEFVDGVHVARQWWERAAAAGDEDAQGYLEILRQEGGSGAQDG